MLAIIAAICFLLEALKIREEIPFIAIGLLFVALQLAVGNWPVININRKEK